MFLPQNICFAKPYLLKSLQILIVYTVYDSFLLSRIFPEKDYSFNISTDAP